MANNDAVDVAANDVDDDDDDGGVAGVPQFRWRKKKKVWFWLLA